MAYWSGAACPRRTLAVFLTWAAVLTGSFADQECDPLTCTATGDCLLPTGDFDDATAAAEGGEEAELLRVSLLQGGLSVRRLPRQASAESSLGDAVQPSLGLRPDGIAAGAAPAAAAVAPPASHGGNEEANGAVTSFLQSELTISRPVEAPKRESSTADDVSKALREATLGPECVTSFDPLALRVTLDSFRAAGLFPQQSPCTPEEVRRASGGWLPAAVPVSWAVSEDLLQKQSLTNVLAGYPFGPPPQPAYSSSHWMKERLVVLTYLGFYLICISSVWYWLAHPAKVGEQKIQYNGIRKVKTDIDVEEATWRSSWLGWLSCSWATNWVARWGRSSGGAGGKIKPDDLPQMGGKDQQARECAKLFQRLWAEEIAQKGRGGASVFRVIVRMWTVRSMLSLMTILGLQQVLTNLYSVVLIEQAMNYFIWLQQMRYAHPEHEVSLTVPLIVVIVIFSSLPFLNCVLTSLAHNIARRLDQRVSGALSVAIFEKAQRLPASVFQPPPVSRGSGEQESKPMVDMMQLIGFDVQGNLQGAYFQVCMAGTSLMACGIFAVMLWMRLGRATLVALSVAVAVLIWLVLVCGYMAQNYDALSRIADRRIQSVRELLTGVRIVKCYAWEEAMEAKITDLRKSEIKHLEKYWAALGVLTGSALMFPRILVISALAAYSVMYGNHSVSNILVCMQILYMLKASCEGLGLAMGRSVTIQPSLRRIESFLKTQEAPVLPPDRIPPWVKFWGEEGNASAGRAETEHPTLSLHGSFAWMGGGHNVLHKLRLDIQKGELVAVLGKVGSGKSTLLQALLGELFPDLSQPQEADTPAWLCRPRVAAYCPQVPHIAEGTLKDNVLFGQDYDQERYDAAIEAASLGADLKQLPGGDLVPVGSRGITLSGGQKARVSMARAAYHRGSEVVLIDDPFGAVDAPTASVLLNELLLGPLMRDRTRVVALQPDAQRLRHFDRVVLLEDGMIQEQGPPSEVMQTQAFQSLLSSRQEEMDRDGEMSPDSKAPSNSIERIREDNRATKIKLRDDDYETRPTWHMLKQYCRIGRWRNILNTLVLFCIQTFIWMFCDLVLANWTNAIATNPKGTDQSQYIFGYFFWLSIGCAIWPVCWHFGMDFTLGISREILGLMLERLLHAPIDHFFDKHPIGRIMNRVVADIASIDFQLFTKTTGTIALVYYTLIPICYVHLIVPWFFTILTLPLYILIGTLCRRYWNTTVPLKYCAANAKSEVNSIIGDVTNSNAVIRAYGEQERITLDMCDAIDNELKATLYGERVLRRWLINRIMFLWSFYTTSMYMVGLMSTSEIGAGTLGLCLSMLLVIEALIEPNLDNATGAQMEFISLARIHEYLSIPQEKPVRLESDSRYRDLAVRVLREDLGRLHQQGFDDISGNPSASASASACVLRGPRLLLEPSACGTALVPAAASRAVLAELCPACDELGSAADWHRIVAVNDVTHDAEGMARELCGGLSSEVRLEVRSGWLAGGAQVEIENLKAGYADIPRDVLKGVDLSFAPKNKVGIVGTTGCGKSSLLLVLLRILEPRAGRVLINGVDTQNIGLWTLRRALGLVPQDPVLFTGTLRQNLDPFSQYTDGRMWAVLALAQLTGLVESWPGGLDHMMADEGSNLSFGQRQLVCLARMVLRQPALLLLDEATSAIDPRTQEIVQETINKAFANSTVVAIAHRLETIMDFDYVAVMDRGVVAEQGPVREVAQIKSGILKGMLAARRGALKAA